MFYVSVQLSKKTNKPYCCLYADLGYRKLYLSFDWQTCSELLGVSVADLSTAPEGSLFPVGDVKVK